MDTTRVGLATLAGLALLASCRIANLFDTPPTAALTVTPAPFADSSAAGAAPHVARLVIATVGRHGPELWNAYHAIDVTWLQFGDSSGITPGTLFFTLDPAGLDPGTYDDQIAIVPVDTALAWVHVRVQFKILPPPPPPPP